MNQDFEQRKEMEELREQMAEKTLEEIDKAVEATEKGIVSGFNKVADAFTDMWLTDDGESVEDARKRFAEKGKSMLEKSKAIGAASLEASRKMGPKKK